MSDMIQRWGKVDTGRVHTDGKRIEAFDADEVAALERELEVTRRAVDLLAERLGGTGYACVRGCSYWTPDDKKTCIRPMDGSCADGVKAGALAEARKQEEANE